ncbi:MAG: hypothetical protein IJZ29_01425 [Clostridia bacterium]|nr:hypothetical protein [Clostridia bacterium]
MSKEDKEKFNLASKFPFIEKLKKIKGIEWIIVVIACLIVFLIYFSTSSTDVKENSSASSLTSSAYAVEIEEKLCKVLSNVKGAGNVNVMITLESGTEIIVATSKEERTNTSSSSNNTTQSVTVVESPVIVGKEPLVLMEILPKIKGVIVVAQGANDVAVRLELLRAVQALIDVDSNQIEIFVGK